MTHPHVNIKRNFNTAINDSSFSEAISTRHDSTRQDHDSSQQTVQDVRTIIQAYRSRQLILTLFGTAHLQLLKSTVQKGQ